MTPDDPARRTEMDDGAVAVRRRFHRLRTIIGLSWDLTPHQFALFKAFWALDLDAGTGWFEAPVFDGDCTAVRRLRFAASPPWRASQPVNGRLQVASEVELADLPVYTGNDRLSLEIDGVMAGGLAGIQSDLEEALALLPRLDGGAS